MGSVGVEAVDTRRKNGVGEGKEGGEVTYLLARPPGNVFDEE